MRTAVFLWPTNSSKESVNLTRTGAGWVGGGTDRQAKTRWAINGRVCETECMGGSAEQAGDNCSTKGVDVRWIDIDWLRISVTPLTDRDAARAAVACTGKRLLLNHNLHSAYLHETDEDFRDLYSRADFVVIDGAPILWSASLTARRLLSSNYRISSTDWIAALPEVGVSRRLFVYGATLEANGRAIEELRRRLPAWVVAGVDGYVDDDEAVARLQRFKPDLVIVGLGMPRQERFLLANLSALPDATYATVGGAIDYLAGQTSLAPRWLGQFGLEWAWRLLHEPRRLAHRYMIEPLCLAGRVASRLSSEGTSKETRSRGQRISVGPTRRTERRR